jgi:hypothetical protein
MRAIKDILKTQIRVTNKPSLKYFITTLTLNIHTKPSLRQELPFYSIGQTSIHKTHMKTLKIQT